MNNEQTNIEWNKGFKNDNALKNRQGKGVSNEKKGRQKKK